MYGFHYDNADNHNDDVDKNDNDKAVNDNVDNDNTDEDVTLNDNTDTDETDNHNSDNDNADVGNDDNDDKNVCAFNYTNICVYRHSMLKALLKSSLHMIKSDLLRCRNKIDAATSSDRTIKSNNLSTQLKINPPIGLAPLIGVGFCRMHPFLLHSYIQLFNCISCYHTLSYSSPSFIPPQTTFSLSNFYLGHSHFL